MDRQLVPAVSPFAEVMGYSRAVRVGDHVYVSGTAPIMADGGEPPADAYGQTRRCLEIVVAALAEVGAGPEHVVRTRVFLVRAEDADDAARAHGEVFREVQPASTMVVAGGLLDPRWLVELEVDAVVSEEAGR
jgi:enamine deaminase RidA (YjgF/YER057c/UK114 family)